MLADDPPPRPPGAGGRPRRHGAKFAFADPATWPVPTASRTSTDDQYGTVTVAAWAGLHPKQHRHPGHGSGGPRPIVRGTIIRVQVERVPAKTRPPKVLWLWWAGPGELDLDLAWRAYTRRFDLEHTVRFCKQTLGWTTPRPRHPEQADRWTWLVLASYTQLRLACQLATDQRLPWERPRSPGKLSPTGCGGGFRACCARSGRRLRRRTLRALPRPAQGPQLGSCQALPGDQETRHQAPEEADQGREGRLSDHSRHHPAASEVSGQSTTPTGLNHKLRPYTRSLIHELKRLIVRITPSPRLILTVIPAVLRGHIGEMAAWKFPTTHSYLQHMDELGVERALVLFNYLSPVQQQPFSLNDLVLDSVSSDRLRGGWGCRSSRRTRR